MVSGDGGPVLPYHCYLKGQLPPLRCYSKGQVSLHHWCLCLHSLGVGGKDTLPPLVHLRWDRYLTLLDTCGGLSWIRKADVVSPGSRSEDSCPFPMHPIWWGSGDVPPTGTRDSCPHMAPGLSGTGWRDRFPQVAFGMQRQAWLPANLAWEAAVVLEQNLVGAGVSGLARY